MNGSFYVLVVLFAVLVVWLAVERFVHRMLLKRIPIRVHVNGTRGKSSVTRLIAAALREGGIRSCAKTTGTLARMIMPDGKEYPLFRPMGANVIEQLRVVRLAAKLKAEALVVECMALQPILQSLSERVMVSATHGVLTNARADHLEVMGPTEEDVARALAGTVPKKAVLFCSERKYTSIFAKACQDRKSKLVTVDDADVADVSDDDMNGFPYMEHKENVALALRVCVELGVERKTALAGMKKSTPDPGALANYTVEFFGRHFEFINGFAANDPTSTGAIWNRAVKEAKPGQRVIALVNCRVDRPDRSKQLGVACVQWPIADHYVLMGTGTYVFAKTATRAGLDPSKLNYAEGFRAEEIFELLAELSGRNSLIIGIANIGGQGLEILRYFQNRSMLAPLLEER
ncbi:MAG: poly-gamma-glutamate synthase PgsB [Myxococcales bacterium]|nr:MAG: poly-gamma-glutamate synthase PgsB [Myxococcales bacterium]